MAEVVAYQGVPGRTNLDLVQKLLTDRGISSRGQMAGMSFESFPPISFNNVWVEEEHLEEASKLIEELAKDGWSIYQQKGGDPDGG